MPQIEDVITAEFLMSISRAKEKLSSFDEELSLEETSFSHAEIGPVNVVVNRDSGDLQITVDEAGWRNLSPRKRSSLALEVALFKAGYLAQANELETLLY